MGDWIDILKNRLENESLPLPENDWEWFEVKFRQRKRRRLLAGWSAAAVGIAAAVALIFMHPTLKTVDEPSEVSKGPEVAVVDEPVESQDSVGERLWAVGERSRTTAQGSEEKIQGYKVEAEPVEETDTKDQSLDGLSTVQEHQPERPAHPTEEKSRETETLNLIPEETAKQRKKITISPYAGGSARGINSVTKITGSDGIAASNGYAIPPISLAAASFSIPTTKVNHAIPVSIGLNVSLPVSTKLSLSSGADFSIYKSRFSIAVLQTAYYLGIPLRLDWTIWEGDHTSAWVGAGGKADRLVGGKSGDYPLKDKSFHWSAIGVAGIDYKLIRGVSLFFQPEISYYFMPASPAILTYRTEHPLMISLDAGFRINL